jgi:hypothetical protein
MMGQLDARDATREPVVSLILGANDRPQLEPLLALLGFTSADGRSYVGAAAPGVEFWFTESAAEPSARSGIYVSIRHRGDVGALLAALETIGLAHETWQHPRFCDVHVTDPSGRVWQVIVGE